jgi:hypothetical protein
MHRISWNSLIATTLLAVVQPARADLTLTISEDPSSIASGVDLNALTPGQQVTFDVTLSGLDAANNQALGLLGATLVFDPSLLGSPLSITAPSISDGGIVPDPAAFLTSIDQGPSPGLADASYLFSFSNLLTPITNNGVFFQFTVAAQDPPTSGSIVFQTDQTGKQQVFAQDLSGNPFTITGGYGGPGAQADGLHFTVLAATSVVPEPSSWLAIALVGTLVGIRQVRLRWLGHRTRGST